MIRFGKWQEKVEWATRSRRFEVALEVHLWSVPYGLVVVRRRWSGRVITPGRVERQSWEIAGTTPPLSSVYSIFLVIMV
jgi:hypothetical protein